MAPLDMLTELHDDIMLLLASLRGFIICAENGDVASANMIEGWIGEAEGRVWFLFERSRRPSSTGN
jgi:starvation-inducible DNA-binding protein